MIILDTSALLAFFRADDPDHAAVSRVIRMPGERIVSPYVVAELDYLVLDRFGVKVELGILEELCTGAFALADMSALDVVLCRRLIATYSDHAIGIADASLVVLADRYGTNRICTLDRRHFSTLRTLDGEPFELLP